MAVQPIQHKWQQTLCKHHWIINDLWTIRFTRINRSTVQYHQINMRDL